jgi:hypothetical protein
MSLLLETKAVDIEINSIDWPRCARCHMPVEYCRATDTGDSIMFVTMCHGETELATIPDDVWDTMMGTHVNLGQAFDTNGDDDETELD